MKNLTIVVLLVSLLSVATGVLAQSSPTVEIILSQATAQPCDIITADVMVRNAVNIGGTDVGITVDECLKIVERQSGDFLPTKAEDGGFSPFSELNEHDTRLAAAIIDRTKLANGDGVFFRVQLEVLCEVGEAPLSVSFAEFSAYVDPTAAEIELTGYTLGAGSVNTVDAQLTIAPAAQVTEVPTDVVSATATPTVSTDATPVPITETQAPQSNQTLLIIVIVLVMVTLIGLILFALARYRRRR